MIRHDFTSLTRASAEELSRVAAGGTVPQPASLAGWEFLGWYAPGSVPSLLVPKHRKGFYRLAREGRVGGYNIPCHRTGPDTPWVDLLRGPGSWRLGWFIARVEGGSLILDYSREGGASRFNPLAVVRERLVQVNEGEPDLLVSRLEVHAGRQVRQVGMGVYQRHTRGPLGI